MKGGVLVAVDSLGRTQRRYPLQHGLAKLGRNPNNDIHINKSDVAPHHATVLVHDSQAEIRSTSGAVTLVNKRAVSRAPLVDGDLISIGGRLLRWEHTGEVESPSVRRAARERRRSAPAAALLALQMAHRASMPGSAGGKQIAVVQPQRRDAAAARHTEGSPARSSPLSTRRSFLEPGSSLEPEDRRTRSPSLLQATKASLWIESRKTSPRRRVQAAPQPAPARRSLPSKKTTPLRMTVLKKAQSAYKSKVIKIEAPQKIDHTKQVAIMLMTGHTPKSKQSITPKNKKSPSYVVKKPSPVRKTPRGKSGGLTRGSKSTGSEIGVTPSRGSDFVNRSGNRRSSKRYTTDRTVSVLEITDSTQNSSGRASSTPAKRRSPKSPSLPSPKKSALKDSSKKTQRKTESIKFDLSHLDNQRDSEMGGTDTTHESDEDLTLRYSESSAHSQPPSPRRPIHSRSSRMLEQVGSPLTPSLASPSRTLTLDSPSARRSLRAGAMVQRVLDSSDRTRSDLSVNTIASDRTRSDITFDPDRTRSDLSEMFANEKTRSRPNSSASDRTDLATTLLSDRTPSNRTRSRLSANETASDRTRSDLSSNTVASDRRSRLSANTVVSDRSRSNLSTTALSNRTKSRVTGNASVGSAFRTRTLSPRHNLESYSVVDLISFDSEDATKSVYNSADSSSVSEYGTPGPGRAGRRTRSTLEPVLLGSSTPFARGGQGARSRPGSARRPSAPARRSPLAPARRSKSLTTPENAPPAPAPAPRPPRASRSRSRIHDDLSLLDLTEPDDASPRTSKRSRTNISETIDISNLEVDNTEVGLTTPENRHSPEAEGTPVLSIRSLLDSSRGSAASGKERVSPTVPARRSRLRLTREPAGSEDEGAFTPTNATKPSPEAVKNKHSTAKKPQSKRSIIDDLNRSDIVKQLFDSPVKRKLTLSMSEFSRKRLFDDDEDGQRKRPTRKTLATGASAPALVADHRKSGRVTKRKSAKNDLTDVRGVKALFAKPPRDDIRRVTGVRNLFQSASPKNDLTDVRGVRQLYQKKSPTNDLRNVSGLKRLQRQSPKNDLTDVRGVRRMFKETRREASYRDVSGIEELYQSHDKSADRSAELFDAMVGRPPIRAVYSRTFTEHARRPKAQNRSLQTSFDGNHVEEWLEKELRRHLPAKEPASRRVTAELKKLATETVKGTEPLVVGRTRQSLVKSTPIRSGASSANQSPARKSSTKQSLTKQLSSKKSSSKQSLSKQSSSKESFNKSSSKKSLSKQSSSKESLSKQQLSKNDSNESPRTHSLNRQSSRNQSLNRESSKKQSLNRQSSRNNSVNKQSPKKQSLSRQSSRNQPSSQESPRRQSSKIQSCSPQSPKKQSLNRQSSRNQSPSPQSRRNQSVSNKSSRQASKPRSPGKQSPGKQTPSKRSPAASPRRRVLVRQRAVHSTPLKGGLQLTMNASELGRVSPIAALRDHNELARDCFVSISIHEEMVPSAKPKSPRQRKLPEKASKQQNNSKQGSKQKSPRKSDVSQKKSLEKSTGRATRHKKVAETAVANTKKRRSSLIVTKKAPVMSPKALKTTNDSVKESPKPRSSRAAKAKLTISKPSPKLKPRTQTTTESLPKSEKVTQIRKATRNKPASPKPSPKGKRTAAVNNARTAQTKSEPKAKTKRAKVEDVIEQPQPKRSRRNAAESKVEETTPNLQVTQTRRGKAVAANAQITKNQPSTRGKKVENKKTAQVETKAKQNASQGRKVQSNTVSVVEEKRTTARGKRSQTETIVQPVVEEKRANRRGNRAQNQTSNQSSSGHNRSRSIQTQTSVQPEVPLPKRGRKIQPQPSPVKEPKTTRGKTVQASKAEPKAAAAVEEKRTVRGKKVETKTQTTQKQTNARGKKVEIDTNVELPPRRGRNAKPEQNESKPGINKAKTSKTEEPTTRGRRAKPDVTVTEPKTSKRKAASNEEALASVPPKKGKTAVVKQKENVSKRNKVEDKKQEVSKPARATRAKPAEPVKDVPRGRKTASPKKKVVEASRGKRKADIEPSPVKKGKKPAAATTPVRGRRAAAAKPAPTVPTKSVRGRRR